MVDVVLVIPPIDKAFSFLDDPSSDRLGVGYLAAYLRKFGHSVEILNCVNQRLDAPRAVDRIFQTKPFLVGLSVAFSKTDLAGAVEIAREIRKRGDSTPVFIGGHPVTLDSSKFVSKIPEISAVARGEGEETILEAVNKIKAGLDWRDIAGLTFCADGRIINNPPRPLIQDLDSLPFPSRDIFRSINTDKIEYARMVSSRGCYGRCSFCSIHSFYAEAPGPRWRARSPKNIVDEIEVLNKEWRVPLIQFEDDTFIGPGQKGLERAYAFGKELIRRKVFVNYIIECRSDDLNTDLLRFLKTTGLMAAFIGLESGVQRTLDFYNKKISVEKNERAVELLRKLELLTPQPGFIMFDPFTTPEEVGENIAFLKRTGLLEEDTTLALLQNRLCIFPGSPVEATVAKSGLLRPQFQPQLGEYIGTYEFQFADPRTQLIYEILDCSKQSKIRFFFQKDRYMDLLGKWEYLFNKIAFKSKLSRDQLDNVEELLTPLVKKIPRWLKARSERLIKLILETCEILKSEPFTDKLSEELKTRDLDEIWRLDVEYLDMSFDTAVNQLVDLLSTDPLDFNFHGQKYSISGIPEFVQQLKELHAASNY